MSETSMDALREQLKEQGYVVVRKAIDGELVEAARSAFERMIERARRDEFEGFHWIDADQEVPGFVSDLLTPAKYDPAYGQILEQVLLPLGEQLLQLPVRLSWLLMLTSGASHPYSVALHRDNNQLGADDEPELLKLYEMKGIYFQAPLLPDSFLQVVPGSHVRLANESEAEIAAGAVARTDVPGLTTIDLQPGDVIFRQTNLMHQGWNPEGHARWTLVSSLWADELPLQPIEFQDYMPLRNSSEFIGQLPEMCQTAVHRYLERGKDSPAASGCSDMIPDTGTMA